MVTAPLTIGVLRPTSLIYPRLGEQLLAGLRLLLAQHHGELAGRPVRLVVEDYGTSQLVAEERAKKLLGWDQVDLVVGLLSINMAATLQPHFEARRAACLVCNLGENVPRHDEGHPAFVQHTLGLWQAAWAFGYWAARTLGPRAIMAQSFYDSGFDLPYAMRHGFEQGGGSIDHTVVTHRPPDRGNFAQLFELAERLRPDVILGSYCGPAATQLVRAYAASAVAGRIPLLGSPLLTEPTLLAEQGAAAIGVRSATAWAGLDATEQGRLFAAALGDQASPFALLGYEAGLLLRAALAATDGEARADALAPALVAATAAGPRGQLRFDPQTRSAAPEAVDVVEVQRHGEAYAHTPIARVAPPGETDPCFDELRGGLRSGWMNTYLSV